MAKLKAPLMSLGATGALGKALVFFGWKGLNVVREYVVPTNPQSKKQTIQRDYLKDAVAAIHAAEELAAYPLVELDKVAEALLGSTFPTPRTWFNTICKKFLDQNVAGLEGAVYRSGEITEGEEALYVMLYFTEAGETEITKGDFWYGKTKTSMPNKSEAAVTEDHADASFLNLTAGTKYFFQFRPTEHADFVGCRSGIYSGIPKKKAA